MRKMKTISMALVTILISVSVFAGPEVLVKGHSVQVSGKLGNTMGQVLTVEKPNDFNIYVYCDPNPSIELCAYTQDQLDEDINPSRIRRLFKAKDKQAIFYDQLDSNNVRTVLKILAVRLNMNDIIEAQIQCKGAHSGPTVCTLTHIR
jgi:hypothetical protein